MKTGKSSVGGGEIQPVYLETENGTFVKKQPDQITLAEVLELVTFEKFCGKWVVENVLGDVNKNVFGSVNQNVGGHVRWNVGGSVGGSVSGCVGSVLGIVGRAGGSVVFSDGRSVEEGVK